MSGDPIPHAPDLPALEPLVLPDGLTGHDEGGTVQISGAAVTAGGVPVAVSRMWISECELNGVTFAPGRAPGLAWHDVVATDCGLSNLDGREGSMRRVAVTRSRLVGFGLTGGELRDVRFTDCSLELASLAGVHLRDVVFERVNLTDASFMDARLKAVAFIDCRLRGTDFRGATITASAIRGASLEGVLGIDALRGLRMPWPDLLDSVGVLAAALGISIEE